MLAHAFCCFCRRSVFIGKVQTEPSSCATIQPSTDHQFVPMPNFYMYQIIFKGHI